MLFVLTAKNHRQCVAGIRTKGRSPHNAKYSLFDAGCYEGVYINTVRPQGGKSWRVANDYRLQAFDLMTFIKIHTSEKVASSWLSQLLPISWVILATPGPAANN